MNGERLRTGSSPDELLHLLADGVGREARLGEDRRDRLVLGAHEPEQEMLGADAAVPERLGLLLGEDDDLPRTPGEALERPGEAARAAAATGPAVGGRLAALDDLMHALVAQAEILGDLAQGAAGRVQAPDGVVVVGPGGLEAVLKLEEAVASRAGFRQKCGVEWCHAVYRSRQHLRCQVG